MPGFASCGRPRNRYDPLGLPPGFGYLAELAQAPGGVACQRSLVEYADPFRARFLTADIQGLLRTRQAPGRLGRIAEGGMCTCLDRQQVGFEVRVTRAGHQRGQAGRRRLECGGRIVHVMCEVPDTRKDMGSHLAVAGHGHKVKRAGPKCCPATWSWPASCAIQPAISLTAAAEVNTTRSPLTGSARTSLGATCVLRY